MRSGSSLMKRLLAALVALMLILSAVAFMEEGGGEGESEPAATEDRKSVV